LVKVHYISLVNLVMDREVVKELIQDDFNIKRLRVELDRILDPENAERMKNDYHLLRKKLGEAGASGRAAKQITLFTA